MLAVKTATLEAVTHLDFVTGVWTAATRPDETRIGEIFGGQAAGGSADLATKIKACLLLGIKNRAFTLVGHRIAQSVQKRLHERGLTHLRVRARGSLLTIESGPEDDPTKHARLRKDTVHLWTLEIADHRRRFEPTGRRDLSDTLLYSLVSDFGWVLEPIA